MTPFLSTRSTILFEDAPPGGATSALRMQRTHSCVLGTLLFTVVLSVLAGFGSLEQRDLGIVFSLIWLLCLAVILVNRRVVKESVHS